MDTANELRGTMVLIHPDLTRDPAGKSGEVGVVTGYEPENDNVYVGFGKGGQGLYGTDAVLVLRNGPAIFDEFAQQKPYMSADDAGIVFKIGLFQDASPSPGNTVIALELAAKNPVVRQMVTRSLEHQLGIEQRMAAYAGR
jgi:hypothetical protein